MELGERIYRTILPAVTLALVVTALHDAHDAGGHHQPPRLAVY